MGLDRTHDFARSKFVAPPARRDATSLIPAAQRIETALAEVPLVLVVAPAGTGKTTALAAWSQQTTDWRPAWVRVDPSDNDARTLAAALAGSIAHVTGAAARRTEGLLAATSGVGVGQLVAAMTNDLDDVERLAVVLDDLHHVRAGDAIELLQGVIDGLGNTNRVVVASRAEPPIDMPQRRVKRQVIELAPADLRLDQSQVVAVLQASGIADADLAARIHQRAGGWAAACVLLSAHAAAMRREGRDNDPLVGGEIDIDRFVCEEILDRLPEALQRFVLETSLLDELDAHQCDAVTGRPGSAAMLREVRQVGLIELNENSWRYPEHIRDVLRRALDERVPAAERLPLARRTAEVSGRDRAIELLIEMGDEAAAAEVIVAAGRELLDQPGGRVPTSWLATFRAPDAISRLAENCVPSTRAWLETLVGIATLDDGDVATAVPHLDRAVATMRAERDNTGLHRAAYARAEAHLMWGEAAAAAALLEELVALPASADDRVRVLAGRLWLRFFDADWQGIEADLDEAFRMALSRCTEIGRSTVALAMGTEFLFAPRGPAWLAQRCTELGRRIDRDLMARASIEVMTAAAHLLAGRVEEAATLVDSLDERALELGGLNWLALAADRVGLAFALAVGDHAAVNARVDAARALFDHSDRHRQERNMYAYALARSGAILGRTDQVRSARLLIGEVSEQDRPDVAITDAVIEATVLRTEGDLNGAAEKLLSVRDLQHQLRFCLLTGLVDLELAHVRLAERRTEDAIDAASPTLHRLRELGALGVLALDGPDTHRPVLEACAHDADLRETTRDALAGMSRTTPMPGVVVGLYGERITGRELEVLALVMAGQSNRGIGRELFISERTVKSHMTSLMRKLEVPSRTAAMARARELGIA